MNGRLKVEWTGRKLPDREAGIDRGLKQKIQRYIPEIQKTEERETESHHWERRCVTGQVLHVGL